MDEIPSRGTPLPWEYGRDGLDAALFLIEARRQRLIPYLSLSEAETLLAMSATAAVAEHLLEILADKMGKNPEMVMAVAAGQLYAALEEDEQV